MDATQFQSALALFNSSRFFEAHEAFEELWREAPVSAPIRRHLQGLVQLSVAFHHQSTGNLAGGSSVLERALRNLEGGEESFPALDFARLRAVLSPWSRCIDEKLRNPETATSFPALPQLLLRAKLQ
jgi:predicted metal-dependent hydrolase